MNSFQDSSSRTVPPGRYESFMSLNRGCLVETWWKTVSRIAQVSHICLVHERWPPRMLDAAGVVFVSTEAWSDQRQRSHHPWFSTGAMG